MTPEERIDANLDAVLRASGSALKHYTMQLTLDRMRKAMRQVMVDSYIAGSNAAHKAMTESQKQSDDKAPTFRELDERLVKPATDRFKKILDTYSGDQKQIAEAVSAEREACALAVDSLMRCIPPGNNDFVDAGNREIQNAVRSIRMRSNKGQSQETDRTGLCTVRDAVAYMHEQKTGWLEMYFKHQGKEWNVEIRILQVREHESASPTNNVKE